MVPVLKVLMDLIDAQMRLDDKTGMKRAEMAGAQEKALTAYALYGGDHLGEAPAPGSLTRERPEPTDQETPQPSTPAAGGTTTPATASANVEQNLTPEELQAFHNDREAIVKSLRGMKNLIKSEREVMSEALEEFDDKLIIKAKELITIFRQMISDRSTVTSEARGNVNSKVRLMRVDIEEYMHKLEEAKGKIVGQETTLQQDLDIFTAETFNLLDKAAQHMPAPAAQHAHEYAEAMQELRQRFIRRERGILHNKEEEYEKAITELHACEQELVICEFNRDYPLEAKVRAANKLLAHLKRAKAEANVIVNKYIIQDDQMRRKELGIVRAIFGENL